MKHRRSGRPDQEAWVQEEAARFWTSPLAMVSEWRSREGTVRFYQDHDDVLIELEFKGITAQQIDGTVRESGLDLTINHPDRERHVTIPLPYTVDPDSTEKEFFPDAVLIRVNRRVSPSDPKMPS